MDVDLPDTEITLPTKDDDSVQVTESTLTRAVITESAYLRSPVNSIEPPIQFLDSEEGMGSSQNSDSHRVRNFLPLERSLRG
jgi:hypothetical protein